MYAIVEIAGQQFKVEKGQEIFVNRLEGDEGARVKFEEVLLIDNRGKINVGTPVVAGATVSVKILEHLKGDKVLVFKKKRRKGYKKTNGHRDYLTRVHIENITVSAAKAKKTTVKTEKTEPKKETLKAATTDTVTKKPVSKKQKPTAEVKSQVDKKPVTKPKAKAQPKAVVKPKAETKPKAKGKDEAETQEN